MADRNTARHLVRRSLFFVALFATSSWALSYGPIEYKLQGPSGSVKPGETFSLHIDFSAGDGVHVYKDKTTAEWAEIRGAKPTGPLATPKPSLILDPLDPTRQVEVFEGKFRITADFVATEEAARGILLKGVLHFQGCTDTLCYAPARIPIEWTLSGAATAPAAQPPQNVVQVATPLRPPGRITLSFARVVLNLAWAFGAGVLISLTPCVLPLVPVTSAIIGGLSRRKGWTHSLALSVVYVFGLSLVYGIAGSLTATAGVAVQNFLNSAYVRIPIAGIFVLLALSMFDVIIIQTPDRFRARLAPGAAGRPEGRAGAGALAAAFGMGMVSGLLAGPCVAAPLLAILIHVGAVASRAYGFWMLFALAWGMGLLLIAAGTAPGLVPRAGAWMLWIKKLFGFVMLWAALFFISSITGDAAYSLATAAVIVAALVFLGCFDLLTAESRLGPRALRALGIIGVAGAVGLGVSGAVSLRGLALSPAASSPPAFKPATTQEVHAALRSGRPLVIDFWAEYCAICKKLEKTMFRDPRVVDALRDVNAFKVDVDREPELAREYAIPGVPVIVFIDSAGKERVDLRSGAPASAGELLNRIAGLKGPPPVAPAGPVEAPR